MARCFPRRTARSLLRSMAYARRPERSAHAQPPDRHAQHPKRHARRARPRPRRRRSDRLHDEISANEGRISTTARTHLRAQPRPRCGRPARRPALARRGVPRFRFAPEAGRLRFAQLTPALDDPHERPRPTRARLPPPGESERPHIRAGCSRESSTTGTGRVSAEVPSSRDCEARGISHETPAPTSRTSVVASARERARPRPSSARPVRRLQEAQHLGREQVGGGVHCGVSLPRHDRDAAVRQSPPQRLAGRLERFAAVAALEV